MEDVIIDSDCGDDDMFAFSLLLYFHLKKEIRIKAITSVCGLLPNLEGAVVARRLLKTVGITDIETFVGSSGSSQMHLFSEANWWAELGVAVLSLGDAICLNPLTSDEITELKTKTTTSVDYLLNFKPQNKTVLLCLGPLTNIYYAIEQDKNFLHKFERIVLMGGNLRIPGNTPNDVSEWNFYADPNAVHAFLSNLGNTPVYMCGLEVANINSVDREDQLKLLELKNVSEKHKTLADVLKKLIQKSEYSCTFDPVAATAVVRGDLLSYEEVKVKVEVNKETKEEGKLIESEDGAKVFLGKSLDRKNYLKLLEHVIIGDY